MTDEANKRLVYAPEAPDDSYTICSCIRLSATSLLSLLGISAIVSMTLASTALGLTISNNIAASSPPSPPLSIAASSPPSPPLSIAGMLPIELSLVTDADENARQRRRHLQDGTDGCPDSVTRDLFVLENVNLVLSVFDSIPTAGTYESIQRPGGTEYRDAVVTIEKIDGSTRVELNTVAHSAGDPVATLVFRADLHRSYVSLSDLGDFDILLTAQWRTSAAKNASVMLDINGSYTVSTDRLRGEERRVRPGLDPYRYGVDVSWRPGRRVGVVDYWSNAASVKYFYGDDKSRYCQSDDSQDAQWTCYRVASDSTCTSAALVDGLDDTLTNVSAVMPTEPVVT